MKVHWFYIISLAAFVRVLKCNEIAFSEFLRKEEDLRKVQASINHQEKPFCFPNHSNSKKWYLSGKYIDYGLQHLETLLYPWCLTTKELGNKLGNYFNEIACARVSGLHFLAIHREWDMFGAHNNISYKHPEDGNTVSKILSLDKQQKESFLNALPDLIVHDNPKSNRIATDLIQKKCQCTRYCWSDPNAPWINQTHYIRKYMKKAVNKYMNGLDPTSRTVISIDTDITDTKDTSDLPLIPDVAIQYRCGDNIGFNYMYGILPFFAFLPPRIPQNVTSIYVLADHPTRNLQATYSSRCQTILESLFAYLRSKFPNTIIVVKRGGDIFLDYARLALANITICSASTFCLWPALANDGIVHYPLTSLIAGADNMDLAPNLGSNFKWIADPLIISDFRKYRPWHDVIKYLKGDIPL